MRAEEIFVVAIIVVPLILVSLDRLRLDLAGIFTALALALGQEAGLGLLGAAGDTEQAKKAFTGFAEPVTITLFSLFVLTRCLDSSGVTRALATRLVSLGGSSERRLIGLLSATSAFFSLFMNNLAAGALVLPSAMEVSRVTKVKPSKLLIPVAYGSCLGGAATYFTSNNIIASNVLRGAGFAPLHILDFVLTGGAVAVSGILFLALVGPRTLPDREASPEQQAARKTGGQLESSYGLHERLWAVHVPEASPFVGRTLSDTGLGERFGLTVIAVSMNGALDFAPAPTHELRARERLLVVGRAERTRLLEDEGFQVAQEEQSSMLARTGAVFSEVVLVPESDAEGLTLKELGFRSKYGLTAVAIRRERRSYRTDVADIALRQGDSILAIGPAGERLALLRASPEFILLETSPSDRPVDWRKGGITIAITLCAVIAAIVGFPVELSMLSAAAAVVVLRLISIEEVYRTMEWPALVLIAGMYPLSLAIVKTGLAEQLSHYVVQLAAPLGSLGLAAASYVITAALSQVVAGQVTTLLTVPVFITAALKVGANPQAVAVASAIACSASFFTPISHPVNALMIGPGNYRFTDFFRAGWGLSILAFFMTMVGMRLVWGM